MRSPTVRRNRIVNNTGCSGVGIAISFGSALIQGNVISDNNRQGCSGGLAAAVSSLSGQVRLKFSTTLSPITPQTKAAESLFGRQVHP